MECYYSTLHLHQSVTIKVSDHYHKSWIIKVQNLFSKMKLGQGRMLWFSFSNIMLSVLFFLCLHKIFIFMPTPEWTLRFWQFWKQHLYMRRKTTKTTCFNRTKDRSHQNQFKKKTILCIAVFAKAESCKFLVFILNVLIHFDDYICAVYWDINIFCKQKWVISKNSSKFSIFEIFVNHFFLTFKVYNFREFSVSHRKLMTLV